MELLTTRTGRGPGRYKSTCQQMHTMKGYIMLRVLLCFMLLASWPGQAARGAVPGFPPGPAPPQNRAPQTVSYIDVGTLYVGGSSATVNASSYFSDPDGDTLTYSVNSPSPTIATTNISGSTVTVAPVAVGTTGKIIVTARDTGGLTATQDFNVTVQNSPPPPPPNRAPTAVGSISNVTLQVGGSSATRSVSGKFSDPDNDTLTYSVNSPSPTIVTTSISGSTVTIAPVAVGTTGKIIVTATDPDGETATQDFTATVENPPPPANRAPTAVGSISNVTLQVGGSSATRSVSSKFSDPDNDTLTYSVSSPSPTIATTSISGSTVTIAPVAAGTTDKIIVTATDPDGETATQDFTATVENPPPPPPTPNRTPTAVGFISDVTLQVGGSSATRSVSGKFSDPDGDTLTYSVNSPSPTIVTTSISGSTVTIAPVALGRTGKIIVTATDPDGETATQDFIATVENPPPPPPPPNSAPETSGSLSNRTVDVGASAFSVSVSGKFSDPDGDNLTFSASSSDSTVATASISSGTLTVTPETGGTTTIKVTAKDPGGLKASLSFTVKVNRRPTTTGSLSNRTVNVGASAFDVTVSGKFSDPDGDNLTFSASSSNTSAATVSVSSGTLTVTPKTGGTTTITATASDSRLTVSLTFTVKVNRRPTTTGSLSNRTVNVGASAFDVTVSGNFSDPDGDNLTFSASSSDTSVATVSESDGTLTVTPETEGATTITVTATDPGGLSVSLTFTVTVAGTDTENQPPTVSWAIPDQPLERDGSSRTVILSSKFSDPDDDILSYSASSSDTTVATVSVSGSIMTITPGVNGTSTVTVIATDPGGLTASQTSTATVSRAPVTSGTIPKLTLEESDQSRSIDVASYFSDPDGEALIYEAVSSNSAIAKATTAGSTVTVTRVAPGTGLVWVTATDPGGLAVLQSMTIRVTNRPPVTETSIVDQTLYLTDDFRRVDLADKFSDPDGQVLAFTATSSNTGIAIVAAGGSTLQIRPVARGSTTVTVRATDPGNRYVEQTFTATVANQFPQTIEPSIGDQTLYMLGGPQKINAALYFSDPDGDRLSYTVNSPSPATVNVSISGGTITLTPVALGNAGKILVTARDPGGLTADQDFTVTVVAGSPPTPTNRVPVAQGNITVNSLYQLGSSVVIDVTPYFSDPDSTDVLAYTVTSQDPGIVIVSISGSSVKITPKGPGTTGKIIVTARDPGGLTADQEFDVTVIAGAPPVPPNRYPVAVGTITVDSLYVEGTSITIDVTSYFSDPDDDILAYSVNSPAPDIVEVSRMGSNITLRPVSAGKTGKIMVTARDPGGLSATQDFNVMVVAGAPPTPTNSAPEIREVLETWRVTIGGGKVALNVAPYFQDPDGDSLSYQLDPQGAGRATLTIADSTLSIEPLVLGTTGKNQLRAVDPAGLYAEQDFVVFVVTNLAPDTLMTIPDQMLTVAKGPVELDLSTFFFDPDQDTLTYTAESSNTGAATVSVTGDTLTITPVEKDMSTDVTVTASDGDLSVAQVFEVTVDNSAPAVADTIQDQTMTVAGGNESLDISDYFSDVDGDDLSYTAESSNTGAATVSVTGDTLTITPVEKDMSTDVTVTASDGDLSVAQVFEVTVDNSAPAVADTIQDQTMTIAGGNESLDLSDYFSDVDGDDLSYTAVSSDTNAATVSVSDASLSITPRAVGKSTVGVTATDNDGASATQSFTVTVTPEPTCPALVGSIADQTLTVGGNAVRINLTQYFSLPAIFDPDYVVNSTDATVTTTSLASDILTVTPGAAGTDSVSVTVSKQDCDPVTHSFVVTVILSCPAAITDAPIQDQTLFAGVGITLIDLTEHFEHIDKDDLEITVTSTSPEIAVLSIEGSVLKIDPKSAGQIATVSVTVTDTAESDTCDDVSLSFMVTVKESGIYPWKVAGENVYRLVGNVGIGVENPDQKLVVDGKIKAEEYHLAMVPADYVFKVDYDLMSLEEVERYIRGHGHLPGIASGTEMKANGFGISRIQTKLLEKIEELSLYVIGQHEQLRAQGHSIDSQRRRLKLQHQIIRQLDHRLERLEQ